MLSLFYTPLVLQSQGLLPSIGIETLPEDNTPICSIPMADDHDPNFEDVGLDAGETAPDFTLYDLQGEAFHLGSALAEGKPVLLVNGSYTCPVFRGKIAKLNRVVRDFGSEVTIAVIYTIEAHPDVDTSVYFGYVNTGRANQNAGILYRQPTTYGERKDIVTDMLNAIEIDAPVYLDGPCNEWWSVYGYAPNNAYLIDTDGTIAAQHGWFDREPHDIIRDLNLFLGNDDQGDDTTDGMFDFVLTSSNIVTGTGGEILYAHGELQNNSEGKVVIDILRQEIDLPNEWSTSLCTDICLATYVDSTQVTLDPGETQSFTLYFYTDATIDTARISIMFRNANNPQNRFRRTFGGITESLSSVTDNTNLSTTLSISPNPFAEQIVIGSSTVSVIDHRLLLYNAFGRLVHQSSVSTEKHSVNLNHLPSGAYFYVLLHQEEVIQQGSLIKQ